eukprot:scaffold6155_cov65-Skeletonema_menzelii.AAC.1
MEDSLRFQLDVAPIYGEPSSGGKASSEEDTTEEVGDELQMKAIQLASDGENMFLTGKAGTGKSWVTKKIVSTFHTKLGKNIHVTAPTGIAAINVGGVTINSWGNYHLGSYFEDFDRMWEKLNACLSCFPASLMARNTAPTPTQHFKIVDDTICPRLLPSSPCYAMLAVAK